MSIDVLIELATRNDTSYEGRVMLRDIVFMLNDFKQCRKSKLIDSSMRKDLGNLVTKMCMPQHRPSSLWEYGAYFRLKNLYLNEVSIS